MAVSAHRAALLLYHAARERRKSTALILVWILSAIYVWGFVDRGWVPHDEGVLAQGAERVLRGELPHQDFDEVYTGGLSYLYAASFSFLGLNLLSIRYVLFVFFLGFVPALYAITLRLGSPLLAVAVTLLGVVWSVPNYFAGIPSWYNLFFATFGALALIRHIETPDWKWLFIAGFCGGLSILAKVSGVFYTMGAFLFLLYREQVLTHTETLDRMTRSSAFFFLKVFVGVIFIGSLVVLVQPQLGPAEFVNLLLPVASIWLFLGWTEWKVRCGPLAVRLRRSFELLLPFGLGVLTPIALFLIPYILNGSIDYLIQGVFVLSQRRFDSANLRFPTAASLVTALPYALLMLFPFASSRTPRLDSLFKILLIILLGVALIFSGHVAVYGLIWYSARGLYVLAILTACYVLFRSFRADWISPRSQLLLLLAALAALVSWVQLPFAHAIYFCYTAPLGLLLFVGLVRMQPDAPRLLHLGVLCFYFLFALIWNNSAYVWYLGEGYLPYRADNVLRLDRAGIRVTDADNALYTELVALIRNRHGPSPYIYAAPDCAEVYYLSGMRNPTRKLYDFLSESENDAAKISERLEARKVNLVVINQEPHFSGKLRPDMLELLEARFPHAQTVGRFTVRWKE